MEASVQSVGILGMAAREVWDKVHGVPGEQGAKTTNMSRRKFIPVLGAAGLVAAGILQGEKTAIPGASRDPLKYQAWSATNLLADRLNEDLWARKREKFPDFEEFWKTLMALLAASQKELEEEYGYKTNLEKFGAAFYVLKRASEQ